MARFYLCSILSVTYPNLLPGTKQKNKPHKKENQPICPIVALYTDPSYKLAKYIEREGSQMSQI